MLLLKMLFCDLLSIQTLLLLFQQCWNVTERQSALNFSFIIVTGKLCLKRQHSEAIIISFCQTGEDTTERLPAYVMHLMFTPDNALNCEFHLYKSENSIFV